MASEVDGTAWGDIRGNHGGMVSGRILKILACRDEMHRFGTNGHENLENRLLNAGLTGK